MYCLQQGLPDVTEVEVNGDGLWRPNGTDMPWRSTITDTGPLTPSAINIKPDPEQTPESEDPCFALIIGLQSMQASCCHLAATASMQSVAVNLTLFSLCPPPRSRSQYTLKTQT